MRITKTRKNERGEKEEDGSDPCGEILFQNPFRDFLLSCFRDSYFGNVNAT